MLRLWSQVRGPFLVPHGAHQCKDDWELIDVDVACCLVCGSCHRCAEGKCDVETNEGWQVCNVTGCCVKQKVFSSDEFVDTIAYMPHTTVSREMVHVSREQLIDWTHLILCSQTTRDSLQHELQQKTLKKTMVFSRLAKNLKQRHKPINIIDLCTMTAQMLCDTRTPMILPPDEVKQLAQKCINITQRFIYTFLCIQSIPKTKHKGFVIGVIFLMRHGIVLWDSEQVLPKVEGLTGCLPSENLLYSLFGVSTKVITQSENLIKQTLVLLPRSKIQSMGFIQ